MTQYTKTRKLAELDARITATRKTADGYYDRAKAASERVERLRMERAWLEDAPVIDPPLPGEDDDQDGDDDE